jgi:hypothetical protein
VLVRKFTSSLGQVHRCVLPSPLSWKFNFRDVHRYAWKNWEKFCLSRSSLLFYAKFTRVLGSSFFWKFTFWESSLLCSKKEKFTSSLSEVHVCVLGSSPSHKITIEKFTVVQGKERKVVFVRKFTSSQGKFTHVYWEFHFFGNLVFSYV